jgi:hypothetical protein
VSIPVLSHLYTLSETVVLLQQKQYNTTVLFFDKAIFISFVIKLLLLGLFMTVAVFVAIIRFVSIKQFLLHDKIQCYVVEHNS